MNMGALVWGIGGGLILYFLTCNFLTLLVKPSWDKPIRTISDLLERDMGLILLPRQDIFIQIMRDSPVDQYNKESFIIQKFKIQFHPFCFQLANRTVSYPDWYFWHQELPESQDSR